ncbi:type I-A CRISPR-associated protein Cas7/Csa2 [Candidatus Bathyarchaeota archaeon]|nr:type I-A CRISPR-associated protein Cas7/Csa2 [Candidatus Bathyarchaeota archaeon]MBS7629278.1 type I-A CRISPR-associated protein Cas7/Csa2 [Candidatus Bathyarchaeota archaeon]
MGFISVAARVLMNLESLGGVETIGNLSRHRTAPIVIPNGEGYTIRFVPVLSGESLAHSYQELLVQEAKSRRLPIGTYSDRLEFLKFADKRIMSEEKVKPPENEEDIRRAEVDVLLRDYVADVGGFLYAGDHPIKRTSCFQVGYAIPALWEKEVAALESQFHVRFAPSRLEAQIPYNVEVGSALYTFTFNLDTSRVGVPSTIFGNKSEREKELDESRPERIIGALSALLRFYSYLSFGAKRSRFLPNMEITSSVASYSNNSHFVVSPGNDKNYIARSAARRNEFVKYSSNLGYKTEVELFAYDREGMSTGSGVETLGTIEEMLGKIIEIARARLA